MTINCTESFDWIIYRDATLAGLATLLPVPYVDDAIEGRFRRQMPTSIAARRGDSLSPATVKALNERPSSWPDKVKSAIFWPLKLPQRWFIRFWRKAVYVLTIRRTVDTLAHYWRRAFLLDHMICAGYIGAQQNDRATQASAIFAFYALLEEEQSDTLTDLAVAALRTIPDLPQAVKNAAHALRTDRTESLGAAIQHYMADNWDSFAEYFDGLGQRFDGRFAAHYATFSYHPAASTAIGV